MSLKAGLRVAFCRQAGASVEGWRFRILFLRISGKSLRGLQIDCRTAQVRLALG
jgi:hypothetical protein